MVGAGPAGMMTAIVAAGRGHRCHAVRQGGRGRRPAEPGQAGAGEGRVSRSGRLVRHGLRHANITLKLGRGRRRPGPRVSTRLILPPAYPARSGDPDRSGGEGPQLHRRAEGGRSGVRVAIVGAGGIGFDVAENAGPCRDAAPRLTRPLAGGMGRRRPVERPGRAGRKAQPRTHLRVRCIFCSARPKSRAAVLARPPAGSTAPALAMNGSGCRAGSNYERITPEAFDQPRAEPRAGQNFSRSMPSCSAPGRNPNAGCPRS